MTLNFEFAFLVPKHGYVASVTPVPGSGYAIDASDTACFRVPASFTTGYEISAQTSYISDIRGHDFLSYAGRWASENTRGISKKSENIINEIGALQALGLELEARDCHKADFKLTLGPSPGSFFADVKKFREYRCEELPKDLHIAILGELAKRGYGRISNVAINATGGWVMHFYEEAAFVRLIMGRTRPPQFCWGGEAALPGVLVDALRDGKERGAKICHIFLNHQNPDEYLLIFNDGDTYANLHIDFREKIKTLVESASDQNEVDAAYYHRRGQFYLLRSVNNPELSGHNIDLALDYLGEARVQDKKNKEIRNSHRLALVAARRIKNDVELEANILEAQRRGFPQTSLMNLRDSSPSSVFRNQYLQSIKSEEDCQSLEIQLNRLNPLTTEWSYSLASGFERLVLIEDDFGGGVDQDRDSLEETPAPSEMLGSIPSVHSGQGILAQRRDTEQNGEQAAGVPFSSQRRPSELSNEQFFLDQRTPSLFHYEQGFTNQRRMTEDGSRWSGGIAPITPSSAVSIEQNTGAQRGTSELSSDQVFTARKRPPEFGLEHTATAQTEALRRAPEINNSESVSSHRIPSELAGDETATARRRSKPGGSQSFEIFRE